MQIQHIAGRVQERIQTGQRARQGQRTCSTTPHRHSAAAGRTQVAAGRGAESHRQITAAVIHITQVNGRQVNITAAIFGDRDVTRQTARVGRIVVDGGHRQGAVGRGTAEGSRTAIIRSICR